MLKIIDLRKIFNQGTINEKIALDKINLQLNEGDFVTIIGSNGAGKSTLLNAIAGVFPVDGGKIELNGQDTTRNSEEKRAAYIGRVFQDPMLGTAAGMAIEENLALAMKRGEKRKFRRGIGKKEREFFREKLSVIGLGLENRLSTKVGLLSGGQRQALTLLMATIKEPKLLLLDEHIAALDPKTGKKVLEMTEDIIGKNHLTALMITHNLEVAMGVGNRTIMMHEGNIVLDLSGRERQQTSVSSLLSMFGKGMVSDRMLLG